MEKPDVKQAGGEADTPDTVTDTAEQTEPVTGETSTQHDTDLTKPQHDTDLTQPQDDTDLTKPDASQSVIKEEQSDTRETIAEEEPEIVVDPAVVEKLTTGLLGLFLPNLQKAKGSLNEVLHNQEVLIETVDQENAKFTESAPMKQLTDTMKEARIYHAKLLNMKKEMNSLMDKSTKLKKRAVKLQQQKHKEVLNRAVQQDRELDREKMLTAKVAKQPQKDTPPSQDPSS